MIGWRCTSCRVHLQFDDEATTKIPPFRALNGFDPELYWDLDNELKGANSDVRQRVEEMKRLREVLEANMKEA